MSVRPFSRVRVPISVEDFSPSLAPVACPPGGFKAGPLKADEAALDVSRIDARYRPVFADRPSDEVVALCRYHLSRSAGGLWLPNRARVLRFYCPFADQNRFASGHRYCINVYRGLCSHGCSYCYAAAYMKAGATPKRAFGRRLAADLADLDAFDVPPAPVHMSNSTDPFQEGLERDAGDTRRALEGLLAHRHRFTSITILTRNPLLAAERVYADLLLALERLPHAPRLASFAASGHPRIQCEVSVPFWRDEARVFWEPNAPPVESRLEGIRRLRAEGIPVILRIDPLFPRSPLSTNPPASMESFGICESQTLDDLARLMDFALEVGVRHVVYSPLKIVFARGKRPPMAGLLAAYRAMAAPELLVARGGSWRLPRRVADEAMVAPFLALAAERAVRTKFCMVNLLETR